MQIFDQVKIRFLLLILWGVMQIFTDQNRLLAFLNEIICLYCVYAIKKIMYCRVVVKFSKYSNIVFEKQLKLFKIFKYSNIQTNDKL